MLNLMDYNGRTKDSSSVQPLVRTRSLYTSHTYGQIDDAATAAAYQGVFEFYEGGDPSSSPSWAPSLSYPGGPTSAIWSPTRGGGGGGKLYSTSASAAAAVAAYYQGSTSVPDETSLYSEGGEEEVTGDRAVSATPHGTVSLRLGHRVRVDMTIDKAVRIINFKNNIILAMNSNGSSCALLHPNGRVHQYGSRVEIMGFDSRGNHKYAKMWYKGVSFTSENCALVYLVDSAGTRTTTDNFSDLSQDFSLSVFYNESRHGASHVSEALSIAHDSEYWITEDGVENWIVNSVRISQAPDGLLRLARNSNKYNLRTSPSNGTASMTTPFVHCTASMGQTSHLFVRRGERRMHYDLTSFIVRNAGHSAGFNDRMQLKVF